MAGLLRLVLVAVLAWAAPARAAPLVVGIDHIPIVVADLAAAQADFRALGFAIKPGRPHADGIQNAHVKFPDGSALELITAPAGVDELTREYRARLGSGDGPVYFGLYAPDQAGLLERLRALDAPARESGGALVFPQGDPLHHLFFAQGEKSPTDRPEHFAHANTALRLSGLFVRANPEERALLAGLGVPLRRTGDCGPLNTDAVAALPQGDVMLVSSEPEDGAVIGGRVEVKSLAAAEAVLRKNGLRPRRYAGCGREGLWLAPPAAHGIWLQFVEAAL